MGVEAAEVTAQLGDCLEEDEAHEHPLNSFMHPHFYGGDEEDEGDAEVDGVGGESFADGRDDEVVEDEEEHDAAADSSVLLRAPHADCPRCSER